MASMHLYALTLQQTTGIVSAVYGNFSAPKAQEIVVNRGHSLELMRLDEQGKPQSILVSDAFGIVRAIHPFRLIGGNKDYLVIGSDSGRIVVVEYNPVANAFVRVHTETYGKTGCRRIVPGQYVAADPKGRAIMVAAIEKQKLVYVLNRDAAAKLTISSPLEAHQGHTVLYSVVGLDVGFNNPQFACLELDHTEADSDPTGQAAVDAEKQLAIYELDLGLNHVVRKAAEPVDQRANMLLMVPGGADGPGGVLVCGEDFVAYHQPGHPSRSVPIPRRYTWPAQRALLLTAAALHKQKNLFFFIVQSEAGDLYKVTLDYAESEVTDIHIKYFDSISPCTSICILRTGFLFAASEFGPHAMYQFQGLGDDQEEVETIGEMQYFTPHSPLVNLLPTDSLESLSPMIEMKVGDYAHDGSSQILALCGRGPRSTLRCLRHGLSVVEMAGNPLPGVPTAIWTVKTRASDKFDRYIVVSFTTATLVLSIGETVEEVMDTGLLPSTGTLAVHLLGDDAIVQVHSTGLRHIRADRRINEWKAPNRKQIVKCAVNSRQVVICLPGGELHYFELDLAGQLIEVAKKEFGSEISCLDIGPIPEGRQRSRFLAVGAPDSTVRILSLDPEDCMQVLSLQAMQSPPESMAMLAMRMSASDQTTIFLNIGLQNGILVRTVLDPMSGKLSDTRHRFLGVRPPKLFKVRVQEREALLALSTKPWLGYTYQDRFTLAPLAFEALDYGSPFCSDACPEGIVAIAGNFLRIISLERAGEVFHQVRYPLAYTPRRMVVHPSTGRLVIIEADHGPMTEEERLARVKAEQEKGAAKAAACFALPPPEYGAPRSPTNAWASCLRMVDAEPFIAGSDRSHAESPPACRPVDLIQFPPNEAAVSLGVVKFRDLPDEFVVVGTARDLNFYPRRAAGGAIHVYRIAINPEDHSQRFELVHTTEVEEIPYAFAPFKGRLLVGLGPILRIYDLGKRRLLRKCENKNFPNFITAILVQGDRIVVGDLTESFHIVRYRRDINQLQVFADNTTPRWLTAWCPLDYNTLAGADKFGNFFVTRLPYEVADIEDDPTGWNKNVLNGAPYKMTEIVQYYVGEPITSLQRATMGGMECIFYCTAMGSIGAFYPFASREEIDFFSHLEIAMRQLNLSVVGRDHLPYRSSYFPVKDVIDGDLCEAYTRLEAAQQLKVAEDLNKPVHEILKKLEDIRNRIL